MRLPTLGVVVALGATYVSGTFAGSVGTVDFSQGTGAAVKRVNGLCNTAPLKGNSDEKVAARIEGLLRDLEIPDTRFHDVCCANAGLQLVDVSRIFPLFHADENDPRNYVFGPTDLYLAKARELGGEIEFRFGEQIEHQKVKFQITPPPDPAKWARICLNIARHYNSGWANGFRWNIRRFSVWEEPDNDALFAGSTTGAYENVYFKMYENVARLIRKEWPDAEIGGPNSMMSYGQFKSTERFLAFCRTNAVPLDFASVTIYERDPERYDFKFRKLRKYLDENGFKGTDVELSEWNYNPKSWETDLDAYHAWNATMQGEKAAACNAAALLLAQDAPVRRMFFYSVDTGNFALFEPGTKRPIPNYFAFRFFAELAHGGAERVACPLRPAKGWYAVASRRPDGEGRLMAAVYPADGGDGTAADEIRLALPGVEHVRIEGISRAFGRVPAPEGSFADGVLTLRRPASGAGTFLVTVPKGSPFWNGCAKWFMAAPAFDFAEVKGAAEYAFEVAADGGARVAFAADTPKASLASVWDKVPEKTFVRVTCTARDAAGKPLGTAGERTFFKTASFKGEGAYPAAKRPLREAAAMAFDYVFDRLARDYRERGEPNPGYSLNSYPSKMEAALIAALVRYAKMRPDRREEALKLARMSAAWLIGVSERADAPLAHFPPTYRGKENEAGQYAGQIMLLYPATVALAYLDLADATGEARWAEAAVRIGETFLKLQGGDGTWYLKMWAHDGSPVAANRCMPIRQMELFDRLAVRTQDARWREASARAFAWLENGPLVTWNWEGQFEDVRPGEPYANLTKHDACDAAQYLLARFPKDARRVRQARELLAFSEDQFVMWERPCRADGKGPDSDNPEKESYPGLRDYRNWHAPSVVEQYGFAIPVDASSAKLIKTYLALDAVTPDPVLRAKARTLAAALTRVQFDSGCVPTILHCEAPDRTREKSGWCWRNCHVASAFALLAASQADR